MGGTGGGRLTGAIRLGGEDTGKERRAAVEAIEDDQIICVFYETEQRTSRGC